MATFLPLVAAALFILAIVAAERDDNNAESHPAPPFLGLAALTACAFLIAAYFWKGLASDAWYAASGFAIGTAGSVLMSTFPRAGWSGSAALAATACGLAAWFPGDFRIHGLLGLIAGSSLSLWFVHAKPLGGFGLAASAFAAADILGDKGFEGASFASAGTAFGLAAASALLLKHLFGKNRPAATGLMVGVLAVAAAGFIVGQRFLDIRDAWVLFTAGLLLALAIQWYMPDDEAPEPFRAIVCAVLWILLATVAFGMRKGFGMSITMVGGLAGFALTGGGRAALTMGPLLGLVLYRVFREMHVDATRALDIGQHYALVGLLLGAALPLLPFEWPRPKSSWLVGFGGVFWIALMLLATIGVGIIMGPKGVIGLVAGLGLSGLLLAVRKGEGALHPLAVGAGLSAATTLLFGWLGTNAQLSREEKLQFVLPLALGAAVIVAILAALSGKRVSTEASS